MNNEYIRICEVCGKKFDLYAGEGIGESYLAEGAMLPKSRYICIECKRQGK